MTGGGSKQHMKIALLSNVTAELLAGTLRASGLEVWCAPGYGAWLETALSPPGDFKVFAPDAIFVVLDSHGVCDESKFPAAEKSLAEAFPNSPAFLVRADDILAGAAEYFDDRMWTLAKSPWSLAGMERLAAEIAALAAALSSPAKKVLALDFDNTLWRGVIGEDGETILPRREFQLGVKSLRSRGVVLVGLTKNNPADVERVWERDDMVLKRDDFAAVFDGWGEKSVNIADAARTLNLSLDSFVFVDDDPVERGAMKAAHGEVATPAFPATEAGLAAFLKNLELAYFRPGAATREDELRTAGYRAEEKRSSLAAKLTLDEYLEELSIRCDVREARGEDAARISQLSQRTNQFNVSPHRYSEHDVGRILEDKNRILFVATAKDKFGDYGLVALVHVALAGEGAARIEDFAMSCRAMNRRIEFTVMGEVERVLAARGVETVAAVWRRTGRNAPSESFFGNCGFEIEFSTEEEKHFVKRLGRGK